jgi:hypothetical protein
MSVMQHSSIPMPGVLPRRQHLIAPSRISIVSLVRAFLAALAWTLAGAGIALAVIIAVAFTMLRLADIDDSSSASLDSPDGLVAAAVLPRDANDHKLWESRRG